MNGTGGQGPDLSRIVNLILQNPALIEQIEMLARKDQEATDIQIAEPTAREEDAPKADSVPASAAPPTQDGKREKRTRLLSALRPYVSERRSKTLDTLIGAMDIFDIIGRG